MSTCIKHLDKLIADNCTNSEMKKQNKTKQKSKNKNKKTTTTASISCRHILHFFFVLKSAIFDMYKGKKSHMKGDLHL